MDNQAIGIDLGTYNSCAAYAKDANHVHIIKSRYGPTLQGIVFPSFLRFDIQGDVIAYGEEARVQMEVAPELIVWGIKRLIGRSFYQIEKELHRFAYPIEGEPDGRIVIPIGLRRYTPAEISALVLKWIKQSAENFNPFIIGQVRKAVITHPAYFDASQINHTKDAAEGAGFDEVELIAEPVAAALAYGIQLDSSSPQFIMAIDWGAGTLDIVIVALRLNKEGHPILSEARPARGNVALGGIDMDDLLVAHAVETYSLKEFQPLLARTIGSPQLLEDDPLNSIEQNLPPEILKLFRSLDNLEQSSTTHSDINKTLWGEYYNLLACIEQAKIQLSKLPAIRGFTTYQGKSIEVKMARTERDCLDEENDWIILESVLQSQLKLFRSQIEFAIEKSGLKREMIHHVLLVGGPMHMPCVRNIVHEIFATNLPVLNELKMIEEQGFSVNPMEAVARGAALYARKTGPALGIRRIQRDYGVILGAQGEILIHDGDGVPCEASLPGALSGRGKPGQAVPIGLYKREENPDGEDYSRMGDYEFVVTIGSDGVFSFLPTLRAEQDKTISLIITDLISSDSMHLDKLSILDGRQIVKPFPFGREIIDDFFHKKTGTSSLPSESMKDSKESYQKQDVSTVDLERVSHQKRAATAALQVAKYAMKEHPLLQTDAGIRRKLDEKIRNVEQVFKSLPVNGPVDQRIFAALANRTTELIHFLHINEIISDKETHL